MRVLLEEIPTHPVKIFCWMCHEYHLAHVYSLDVSLFCPKCGTQAEVKPLPEGIGVCWEEERID